MVLRVHVHVLLDGLKVANGSSQRCIPADPLPKD
jgi:hypothetical protein